VQDKIIFSIPPITFIIFGVLCVIFPSQMFKTAATNTLKKKPTQANIITYKIGGVVFILIGATLVFLTLFGYMGI